MNKMERLLHYFRNADNPQLMADKVIKAIETLGEKYVGHPKSTFVFQRAGGMFGRVGNETG